MHEPRFRTRSPMRPGTSERLILSKQTGGIKGSRFVSLLSLGDSPTLYCRSAEGHGLRSS